MCFQTVSRYHVPEIVNHPATMGLTLECFQLMKVSCPIRGKFSIAIEGTASSFVSAMAGAECSLRGHREGKQRVSDLSVLPKSVPKLEHQIRSSSAFEGVETTLYGEEGLVPVG